ncbi:hypothetical protein ABZ467_07260 [Streptomyces sp. NPDC005727]|uniref:hypothetical protein n=1 Tax=Streptomyces sp. NPDC005727 TaxID=3157053 RepID=UPI00340697B2
MVGTGAFDPFDIVMSAPIACASRPFPGTPGDRYPPNLFPAAATAHAEHRKIAGQPPVTRQELGFYTIQTLIGVLFCRVRSHWGSHVTADTENNPLIGLPNQHIVGLTYVP